MKTKSTGLPIVPQAPSHWEVKRLKEVASIVLGKMLSTERTPRLTVELPYIRSANLSDQGPFALETLKRMWFSPIDARRLAIRNDDILVSEGGSIGQPMLVKGLPEGVAVAIQNSVNRVRGSANQHYLFYWLKFLFEGKFHQNNIDAVSIGHLTKEKLADVPVLLPPQDEQDRLVRWLDVQLYRIQRRAELLRAKRELMRELLASATEHATLGSESSAPKESTSIDWLPKAPRHWKVVRLESLFKEVGKPGRDNLPILSVSIHTGVSDRELGNDELERKVARSEDKSLYKQVRAGDLIYNQMRAWQGGFGVAKLHGMVSPAYVVARPNGRVNPFFMEYLLRSPSAVEEMRRRSRGIADFRLRLYWDKFKDIRVALPPLAEQNEIVKRLDVTAGLIRSQIRAIERLEALLAEQSKCLLRDAMTGSVDTSQREIALAQAA